MKRTLFLATTAAAATLSGFSAHAGCANLKALSSSHQTKPVTLPASGTYKLGSGNAAKNIVGTWLVSYTAEGAAAGQAYIQWHSDGTEWENINFPVDGGNICMGSWTATDSKHVSRNHWGWLYTSGVVSGTFNETETDQVAKNSTYSGTNDTKVYDLNGNLLTEFTGTSSATLISP